MNKKSVKAIIILEESDNGNGMTVEFEGERDTLIHMVAHALEIPELAEVIVPAVLTHLVKQGVKAKAKIAQKITNKKIN